MYLFLKPSFRLLLYLRLVPFSFLTLLNKTCCPLETFKNLMRRSELEVFTSWFVVHHSLPQKCDFSDRA